MKYLSVFLLLVVTALTGCIDYESRIRVRPDGSGVLIETVRLNETLVDFLRTVDKQRSDSTLAQLFDEDDLRRKAAHFGPGVSYVSGRRIEEQGLMGYIAVYAFTDVEKLELGRQSISERLAQDAPNNPAVDFTSPVDRFRLAFSRGDGTTPSTLRVRVFSEEELRRSANDAVAPDLSDTLQDSYLRLMRTYMKGMNIRFVVEPEGTVVSTNARHRDTSGITLLAIDFDELLRDDRAVRALVQQGGRAETLDEVERLFGSTSGIRAEFGELVIRFR